MTKLCSGKNVKLKTKTTGYTGKKCLVLYFSRKLKCIVDQKLRSPELNV